MRESPIIWVSARIILSGSAPTPRQRSRTWDLRNSCRVLLGTAKLLGGITLIVPGLFTLKEWAYAGFTFAWIAAVVAHYLAKDGAIAFFRLILLVLLFVSYFTQPARRRLGSKAAA